MLEMKITITAPDLAAALNNLAAALDGKKPHTVCNQYSSGNGHIDNVGAINMGDEARSSTPTMPVSPVPTAPALGVPLSATPVPIVATTAPAAAPAPVQPPATPPIVPVAAAPTYNRDQIMTAGAALIDAGKINELIGLLNTFGVQAVTQLKQDQLGAFATELRKLGAQI